MEGESKLDDRNTTIIIPVSLRRRLKRLAGMLDMTYSEVISNALDEMDKTIQKEGIEYFAQKNTKELERTEQREIEVFEIGSKEQKNKITVIEK